LVGSSRGIRIEIPIIMIDNNKVEMKANLHYDPNGLHPKNGMRASKKMTGKIENDFDKGMKL